MKSSYKYTILAIDDAKDTLMLLNFDLGNEGYRVITATSGEDGLSLVHKQVHHDDMVGDNAVNPAKNNPVDLVLLDMYMPAMSGLSTLKKLKSHPLSCDIPVIMLSASDDEDEIVEALELGADDYVTKPYIAKVLLARIKTSLRLLAKTRELELLAKTDFLTTINNRANFYELSTKAINQCRRNQQSLVIAMFDIDFFKQVNDDFGHDIGDLVLVEFAKILSLSFRDYDVVARIGGEEFAVCMPNTSMSDAMAVCERFRVRIENHQVNFEQLKQQQITVTVSIGVAAKVFDNNDSQLSVDVLLKLADQALYHAKDNGRNITVNAEQLYQVDDAIALLLTESIPTTTNSEDQSSTPLTGALVDLDEEFPGIDVAVGLANVLEDKALFYEILILFYQDHAKDGEKLKAAISTADIKSAKHLIHTLKGVACSVGAMGLFNKSKALDSAINNDQQQLFDGLLNQGVLPELEKVITGIKLQLVENC